jgi:hypothetical protein
MQVTKVLRLQACHGGVMRRIDFREAPKGAGALHNDVK